MIHLKTYDNIIRQVLLYHFRISEIEEQWVEVTCSKSLTLKAADLGTDPGAMTPEPRLASIILFSVMKLPVYHYMRYNTFAFIA